YGDAVHLLRDERLEDFLLPQLVCRLGRAPDDVDVAALRRLAFGAGLRVVEDGQVERLRHDGEPQPGRGARFRAVGAADAEAGNDDDEPFHQRSFRSARAVALRSMTTITITTRPTIRRS